MTDMMVLQKWYVDVNHPEGKPTGRSLDDLFHPQARFFYVSRNGDDSNIFVRGRRPRIFNLGYKEFMFEVAVKGIDKDLPIETEAYAKDALDQLEAYLLKH